MTHFAIHDSTGLQFADGAPDFGKNSTGFGGYEGKVKAFAFSENGQRCAWIVDGQRFFKCWESKKISKICCGKGWWRRYKRPGTDIVHNQSKRNIEFDELNEKKDEFFIIDVRSPGELEYQGHIPNAHNIPLSELDEAMALDDEAFSEKYGFDKPKEEDTVVTLCQKGGRARKAREVLVAAGFITRVYGGSFEDWKANGGDVEFGKE